MYKQEIVYTYITTVEISKNLVFILYAYVVPKLAENFVELERGRSQEVLFLNLSFLHIIIDVWQWKYVDFF